MFLQLKFRPKSGSMLLYSRKKVRYRRDGYCWKKRKDGKTTREDHMKLKVQGMEVRKMLWTREPERFLFTVPLDLILEAWNYWLIYLFVYIRFLFLKTAPTF